jgi:hypothetical protein
MDILFCLYQLLGWSVLGYGAWQCLLIAGKYDAESLRADLAGSSGAHRRGHAWQPAEPSHLR